MKKLISLLMSLSLITSVTCLVANADGAYCPDDVPIATETEPERVDEETLEALQEIRDSLIENVYSKYTDFDTHSIAMYDTVNKAVVCYSTQNETELEEAISYCKEQNYDLSLVKFYLCSKSGVVNEVSVQTDDTKDDVIENHSTIISMLEEYIEEQGLIDVSIVDDTKTGDVTVTIYYVYSGYQEKLESFISDNNISSDEVTIITLEDDVEVTTDQVDVIYGDLNGDSSTTIGDVVLLNKYLVGNADLSEDYKTAADVNLDGEIDATDATIILGYNVSKITSLPYTE